VNTHAETIAAYGGARQMVKEKERAVVWLVQKILDGLWPSLIWNGTRLPEQKKEQRDRKQGYDHGRGTAYTLQN
jgi:hypothetical protein